MHNDNDVITNGAVSLGSCAVGQSDKRRVGANLARPEFIDSVVSIETNGTDDTATRLLLLTVGTEVCKYAPITDVSTFDVYCMRA